MRTLIFVPSARLAIHSLSPIFYSHLSIDHVDTLDRPSYLRSDVDSALDISQVGPSLDVSICCTREIVVFGIFLVDAVLQDAALRCAALPLKHSSKFGGHFNGGVLAGTRTYASV